MHPIRNMLEFCFDHGIHTFFALSAEQIRMEEGQFGFPDEALEHAEEDHDGVLYLKFAEAQYFDQMNLVLEDDHFSINVGFGTLCRVSVPYEIVLQASIVDTHNPDWKPANPAVAPEPKPPALRLV